MNTSTFGHLESESIWQAGVTLREREDEKRVYVCMTLDNVEVFMTPKQLTVFAAMLGQFVKSGEDQKVFVNTDMDLLKSNGIELSWSNDVYATSFGKGRK